MDELDLLINEIGINIQIFIGTETIDDPNYIRLRHGECPELNQKQ